MNVQLDSYSRWSRVAVVLWLALFTLQLAVFVAGMIVWLPHWQQLCFEEVAVCQQRLQLPAAEARALPSIGWSLESYARYNLLVQVVQKSIAVVVAGLIFWRKPNDRMAWLVSAYLMIGFGTTVAEVLVAAQLAWVVPARLLSWSGSILFALFFSLFPSGRFVPHWTRWATVVWSVLFFPSTFFPGTPLDLNQWGGGGIITGLALIASFLGAQAYRYRHVSNTVERQQTKWVVLAMGLGVAGLLASLGFVFSSGRMGPRATPYFPLVELGFGALNYLLPLAIGIAILRHRLFDIDIIIRRTLIYSVLTGILGALYFGGIVVAQQLFKATTGQGSDLAIVVSTLLIAALFNPLRRLIQETIDRRFYRRKYDAEQTLARFSQTLRDEVDIETLKAQLLTVVDETMQPTHVTLWVKEKVPASATVARATRP